MGPPGSNGSSGLRNGPGGRGPSYQVLAAHLHVHAAVFTQEALAKHMTSATSPANRPALPRLLPLVWLGWAPATAVLL